MRRLPPGDQPELLPAYFMSQVCRPMAVLLMYGLQLPLLAAEADVLEGPKLATLEPTATAEVRRVIDISDLVLCRMIQAPYDHYGTLREPREISPGK